MPKDVMFVLDYSGSMAGAKIKSAITNMKTVLTEHIFEQDNVGFLVFSNKLKCVFSLQQKSEKKMTRLMEEQNTPNVCGKCNIGAEKRTG
jgi:hypothetical protein